MCILVSDQVDRQRRRIIIKYLGTAHGQAMNRDRQKAYLYIEYEDEFHHHYE